MKQHAAGMLVVCCWHATNMLLIRCWYAAGVRHLLIRDGSIILHYIHLYNKLILAVGTLLVTEEISHVIFGNKIGTRFSQVFGVICISGGHQDLPPDFYQFFSFISVGISRIQRGKPTRNL